MAKNILALTGLVAVIGGLGFWQFGFFSDVAESIERETAVARAHAIVKDMEQRATTLTDKVRSLRIEATKREKQLEREITSVEKTKAASKALATAARGMGLPKPSSATDQDRALKIQFVGRTMTGDEVYKTLEKWNKDASAKQRRLDGSKKMVERIRDTATQLESKQETLLAQVEDMRNLVAKLEMQRDLAELDKELAELGATISGNPAGELKGVIDTLQDQIDEYEATQDVLLNEINTKNGLTPEEALSGGQSTSAADLDSLWDDAH